LLGSELVEGELPGECSDMQDNDGDGKFDCFDPGCEASEECATNGGLTGGTTGGVTGGATGTNTGTNTGSTTGDPFPTGGSGTGWPTTTGGSPTSTTTRDSGTTNTWTDTATGTQTTTGTWGGSGYSGGVLFYDDFEASGALGAWWSTSGSGQWFVDTNLPLQGSRSARSGSISHNQSTSLELTATFPTSGVISFDYSVSSEQTYDYLEFYIDGVLWERWSGLSPSGSQHSQVVSAGTHTFTWSYAKDGSVSDNADAAWIDEVVLTAP